jgi:hypothetical protein
VSREWEDSSLPFVHAAIMTARDPELPSEEVYRRCFAQGILR